MFKGVVLSQHIKMKNLKNLSPEQIVQKQLIAYNNRDIASFMALFSDGFKCYDYHSGELTIDGFADCQKFYQSLFDLSPNLHSTIIKRVVLGNTVIDHEHIIGRKGSNEILEMILIFEVKEEKIHKITVIK